MRSASRCRRSRIWRWSGCEPVAGLPRFRWLTKRNLALVLLSLLLLGTGGLGWVYHRYGLHGLNVLWERGGSYWVTLERDSPRLSPAMRLALQEDVPPAHAEPPDWQEVAPGFAVAEMPVRAGTILVDRLLLARIDPARFRLVVRNAPAGDHGSQDWLQALGATLVVNGSYYDERGAADTPTVSDGRSLGPATYVARHGAFVASAGTAGIVELRDGNWREALAGGSEGFVSYPLLLARDGTSPTQGDPHWLANRSFVAEDRQGRILIGTTEDAFFSLPRLAAFLRSAPLDLAIALNLDGGPVACQAIAAGAYRRDFCGAWETHTRDGELRLLRWPFWWRRFNLPVVLAAVPR